MQVKVIIESTDQDGIKSKSENFALMSKEQKGYRLSYSEDLSGEGELTETTMFISPSELRIIRRGELVTDFIYSESLTHNTSYETPFGIIPITLITQSFEYLDMLHDADTGINISSSYTIDMGDSLMPPASMDMNIIIKEISD
ncbi:MAG: DUF1934 domain-containing protein [Lachnospiraceae bacterium]|nr:DUF1934 domain-containing protein [Lachnospiraceae bacterium]